MSEEWEQPPGQRDELCVTLMIPMSLNSGHCTVQVVNLSCLHRVINQTFSAPCVFLNQLGVGASL